MKKALLEFLVWLLISTTNVSSISPSVNTLYPTAIEYGVAVDTSLSGSTVMLKNGTQVILDATSDVVIEQQIATASSTLSNAGFTAASLTPYVVGAVAVGSAAYLGYDIYSNWGTIEALISQDIGIDPWFEEYAQQILDGTVDLSNGIEVPVGIFNKMTVSLSEVLTFDMSQELASHNTMVRTDVSQLSTVELTSWLTTLGYTGTIGMSTSAVNPLIAMYNEELQDYIIFQPGAYYDASMKDLLFQEVGGIVYSQLQYDTVVNDIGYAMQPTYNMGALWTSIDPETGNTLGIAPEFTNFNVNNGSMTCTYNDSTYNLSVLVPDGSSVVYSNIAYSDLEFPVQYYLNDYTMIQLLPAYYQVTVASKDDMSVLNDKVNTQELDISPDMKDSIDNSLNNEDNVVLPFAYEDVGNWVDEKTDDTSSASEVYTEQSNVDDSDTNVGVTDTEDSGILSGLLGILQDFAYWLFVPSDGFMDGFLDELTAIVEDSTGILTYPIVAVINFLGRVNDIGSADAVLTMPQIDWKGYTLIPTQSINLSAFIRDNAEIQKLYNYYLIFCRGLLIFYVLNLARKKEEQMTRG